MIKLRLDTTFTKLLEFVNNELSMALYGATLRVDKAKAPKIFKSDTVVDDVIWYLTQESKRASIVVDASKYVKQGKIQVLLLAIILRASGNDMVDVYLDTSEAAIQKGLLNKQAKKGWARNLMSVVGIALLLLMILFPPSWPFMIGFIFLAVIISPFHHFSQKRRFKRDQKELGKLAAIFESNFSVKERMETDDFVTYWGKVKSNFRLSDFTP